MFALLVFGSFHVSAETFWDGLVSYNPPLPMVGGDEAGNAGLPANGFELRSEGTTNGYAQVTFQISSIMMLFNNPSEMPKEEIKTISDLKKAVDVELQEDLHTTNYSVEVVKFDGRDAVCNTRPISDPGPIKWYYRVTFLWQTNSVRRGSSIFSVFVAAEKRETFDKLLASLKTVKIRSTPPPVKLAKDEMQLGLTHDEIRQRCGEPLVFHPPDETYITDKYLIEVEYFGPRYDKADIILYRKVRDSQNAAAVLDQGILDDQILPINKDEAEEILKRHTGGGGLTWSPFAENRWKRSDGAMAALTSKDFRILTAEMWPRQRFD